jgi:hypothetical protein
MEGNMSKKYEVKFSITGSRGDVGSFSEDEKKSFSYDTACRVVGAKVANPIDWEFDYNTGKEKVEEVKPKEVKTKKAKEAVTEVEDNGRE